MGTETRAKKRRKPTPASIRRKALREWSLAVRQRDGGKCAVCGSEKHCQAHHLLPKQHYKHLMLDLTNGLTLCVRCHKWSKYAAHSNGLWFSKWLAENRAQQFGWTMKDL